MALFYLLLALLLLFGIVGGVVYFFTDIADQLKYIILGSLIVGWGLTALYSYHQQKERIYHERLYFEYNHGKDLLCRDPFGKEITVNRRLFNFNTGTMVFFGRDGTEVAGLVIPIDRCRVKEGDGSRK
ncbi:MAG: hypothetical protein GXO19_04930 [Epsilonproteobacteria bacterium]|nr:hypothetical protein [Campylobacterota bacterium]NPA57062.1 hypothetical protein [Campylobacterota bacterium]